MSKWLKKTPQTINDMWQIIEEAKTEYEMFKTIRKNNHKAIFDSYLKAGIVIGSKIILKNSVQLKDTPLTVTDIRTDTIKARDVATNKGWRLKGYRIEDIEVFK